MKKYTYETVNKAIAEKGLAAVREAIFPNGQHEYIAISMFIDSRQSWCKKELLKKIQAL